ncbi:unnamed protein product [Rhizophagus irregularis]|nr:unnamed protein product [Rhizophagus irregularis]
MDISSRMQIEICGKRFSTPQCKPTAQPQNPTPEIVPSQPQLEQLQEPTPEVIPAPAKKTPNLPIDELVKCAPQTDIEWFAYMQGDYEGRYTIYIFKMKCVLGFLKA